MKKFILIFPFLLLINISIFAEEDIGYNEGSILSTIKTQTDVNNAKFIIKNGVPYLDVKNVGVVFHPAWTGLYALQYADKESFYPKKVKPNDKFFFHLVKVLEDKLTYLNDSSAVWIYNFDNTYNNVYIKAPWYSSFAQAIGIEVFLTAYKKTNDKKYLELAKKVANPLITPLKAGGLMYQNQNDIWFEEIPLKKNPTHILNAHLRSLIALHMLYQVTNERIYKKYFDKGFETLKRWLPQYDTGSWLKYDLNPKYKQLFRITNPYGFKTEELSIDKISILDKNLNILKVEDIGDNDDFESNKSIYLSGIDWKSEYKENNITLRKIKSSLPANFKESFEAKKLTSPYTFINIKFPKTDDEFYYLKIDFKDDIKGNLVLQKRTIMPKIKFKDVDNGIFLMKGDKKLKSLIVKIDKSNMGYYTGLSYANKHYLYLKKLYEITKDIQIYKWQKVAKQYINTVDYKTNKTIKTKKFILPKQTPVVPIFSLTKDGVVAQHFATNETKRISGVYDFKSPISCESLSPYIISLQAEGVLFKLYKHMFKTEEYLKKNLQNYSQYDWVTIGEKNKITKENALNWLKNNAHKYKDALTWSFDFNNSYNDMVQTAPWRSAFAQAYVIKAFIKNGLYNYAIKGANAYKYDITKGGVSSFDKSGNIWFEEVPNKTHILNAHLISENVLLDNLKIFNSKDIDITAKKGLKSLEKYISKFDAGYWSKYDQNPKKELLFQFDWISGEKSPLIDEICLVSSVSHTKTCLDVGSENDFEGNNRIAGLDWLSSFKEDGKTVRNLKNGYKERAKVVKGGARHNVFVWMSLPDRKFVDMWDITPYYLIIKYKDVAKGKFDIKIQSIREGNFLEFMPLFSSYMVTKGDKKWKEFIVPIRTNDLGWYLGIDYHKYHIQQLNNLIKKTNNITLKQVAQRWQYYLDEYLAHKNPIVEPERNLDYELKNFVIKSNLKYYDGYELKNAIDGDPNNNYVAALENINLPHIIEIDLKKEKFIDKIQLIWESNINNPAIFEVKIFDSKKLVFDKNMKNFSKYTNIDIFKRATKIKLIIRKYNGQNRLLMRAIRIIGKE